MLSRLTSATPLNDYLLDITLENGSKMLLNLQRKTLTARFGVLKDPAVWALAATDGYSIHWGELLSITLTEALEILTQG